MDGFLLSDLLLLNVGIVLVGAAVVRFADRWPRVVVLVSMGMFAAGAWVLWTAGDVMEAAGIPAGHRWLRIGVWIVALAVAAWGLMASHSRNSSPSAAATAPLSWPVALGAYWLMCFGVATFESIVLFLGLTPPGKFR